MVNGISCKSLFANICVNCKTEPYIAILAKPNKSGEEGGREGGKTASDKSI